MGHGKIAAMGTKIRTAEEVEAPETAFERFKKVVIALAVTPKNGKPVSTTKRRKKPSSARGR